MTQSELTDYQPNGSLAPKNDRYKNQETPWRDKSTLRELYYEKQLSHRDIADELGTTKNTVRRWMDRHGLPSRDNVEAMTVTMRKKPTEYRMGVDGYMSSLTEHNGKTSLIRIHTLLAIAEGADPATLFGKNSSRVVHHKNGIPWDNRPGNLEVMSRPEHNRLHAKGGKFWDS